MMKSTISLFALLLICSLGISQPINSFPYVENFDGFPNGIQGSVTEPNPDNANFAPWANEIANDGPQDWYSVSGSTPSGGTGPTADNTTGSGRYLFIEDSGGGANNDTITLLTPVFRITSIPDPRMAVWVHSDLRTAPNFGGDSSHNDVKIEIFSAGSWVQLDSIGDQGQVGWVEHIYDLTPFKSIGGGIVQIRFRANNNNYGDFTHDIAIDDFSIYDQPTTDGALTGTFLEMMSPTPYTLAPLFEGPVYEMSGLVVNRGLTTLTDVTLVTDFGGVKDSVQIDSLQSFGDTLLTIASPLVPTMAGPVTYTLKVAQNDTFPNNTGAQVVVDTTFARDDSAADGGLGFTGGTGVFGNMFEITSEASLTSASFFLNSSTIGDTLRVWLFGFGNDIPGEPDTSLIYDVTDPWEITGLGWQTLPFECQPTLAPGQYFISIQQVNTNNLGFGYDVDNFVPGTAFFGNGANRWTDLATIPSLASCFLLRMNFGPVTVPKTNLAASTNDACAGDTVMLTASGTGNYRWVGNGISDTVGTTVTATSNTPGFQTYLLIGEDANGCISFDTVTVGYGNLPPLMTSADTGICAGSPASLSATGAASYLWNTGDTTASIMVSPMSDSTYTVTGFDLFGCNVSTDITVNVTPSPSTSIDSTNVTCAGASDGRAEVIAVGGAPGAGGYQYLWSNGEMVPNITGLAAGVYTVTVTDSVGCSGMSSVTITEPDSIALASGGMDATNGMADGSAYVTASGGTPPYTYAWDDANTQTTDTATSLAAGVYTVVVTDANGCSDSVSVTVGEMPGVGIDDLLDENLISLYPNPNAGTFIVSELNVFGLDKKLDLVLFDLTGRKVMSQSSQGQDELSFELSESFQDGIYLLHITSDEARVVKRVVVKR